MFNLRLRVVKESCLSSSPPFFYRFWNQGEEGEEGFLYLILNFCDKGVESVSETSQKFKIY